MGLIPQLLGQESDSQIANVGLTYQVTVEANSLKYVQSSLYLQLEHDFEAAQNATIGMDRDAYRLAQKYERALNHYVAIGVPILAALAGDAYTFYKVTSSYISAKALSATYAEAQGALDAYEGTDPAVLATLEATAEDTFGAAVGASLDLLDAGLGAAAEGSATGGFWAAILTFFLGD